MNFLYLLVVFSIGLTCSGLNASEAEVVNAGYAKQQELDCSSLSGSIKWYQYQNSVETPVENKEKKYLINDDAKKLMIFDIRSADIVGKYGCKSGDSKKEFVINTEPALFETVKSSQTQSEGSQAKFECKLVAGFQNGVKVVWTWSKDNKEISNQTDKYEIKISEDGQNSNITVFKVTLEDAGNYTCKASNALGKDDETNLLRVKNTLAALWPFIGIIIEVAVLCVIILIFEKKCGKKEDDENEPQAQSLMAAKDVNNDGAKKRAGK